MQCTLGYLALHLYAGSDFSRDTTSRVNWISNSAVTKYMLIVECCWGHGAAQRKNRPPTKQILTLLNSDVRFETSFEKVTKEEIEPFPKRHGLKKLV